jgi:hypothetical protein
MRNCRFGECWYAQQGFGSCYGQPGGDCVMALEQNRASRLWRCPECGKTTTAAYGVDMVFCEHDSSELITMNVVVDNGNSQDRG